MAVETTPVCEHGIAALTLSAWRDGDLPDAEARDVAAHVATCPACRVRLGEYDRVIAALRAQQVPVADARLRRGVERFAGGAGSQEAAPPVPLRRGPPDARRRLWGTLGAVAALLLIVGGFTRLFTSRTSSSGPTRGAPAVLSLSWTQGTLPAGVTLHNLGQLAVAADNGNVAYACVPPLAASGQPRAGVTGSATQIWATSDRAARWTRMTNLPLARHDSTSCAVMVDDLNPSHLVAVVTWQRSVSYVMDPRQSAAFVSDDGGASWQALTNPADTQILEFATHDGTTYALMAYTQAPALHTLLYASDDGMRTWRPLDAAINAADDLSSQFSIRADTGALLLQANDMNAPEGRSITDLWTSDDGGAHWSKLAHVPDASYFAVAEPRAGQPWSLCGTNYEQSKDPSFPDTLWCSADGGSTWQQRSLPSPEPLPPSYTPVPQGGNNGRAGYGGVSAFAVTSSGAVLAQVAVNANVLYRLVPGSGQWQSLGNAPARYASVSYAGDANDGVLWALSGGAAPTLFGAGATGPLQVFTAPYPG